MESVEAFIQSFSAQSNEFLVSVLRDRSACPNEAAIAAGKVLTLRGVDLVSIKDQIDPSAALEEQEYFSEETEANPDYDKYKEEIEQRILAGASPETVYAALKEKGYDGFKLLNEAVEKDESLKGNNISWKTWLTAIGVILFILRLVLRS